MTKNNIEDEHNDLDQAMNELSRQTDELLSQTKSQPAEKPKPTLPKKKVIPHRKGTHLDIISSKPQINQHRSTQTKVTITEPEEEELLPAHAGQSFNEKSGFSVKAAPATSVESLTTKQQVTEKSTTAAIVRPHEGRAMAGAEYADVGNSDSKVAAENLISTDGKFNPVSSESDHSTEPSSDKSNLNTQIEVDEQTGELETKEVASKKEAVIPEVSISTPSNDIEDALDLHEVDDTIQKPTVFDTNEYHPELHDWSKKAHPSHWPLLITMLLILAISAGLAYYYFTYL